MKLLLRLLTLSFRAGSFLLVISSAHASLFGDSMGISPFENWKMFETEHFRVSYPKSLENQAMKAGQYLEEAHTLLSPKMLWTPKNRVNVIALDQFDTANGSTAAALRFGMILYLTPPDVHTSIAHYENWLRLLVFHEYSHTLNLDVTHDFYSGLRVIFGDILLPNGLWPRWMLEGLAVYNETAFTQAGRGRSAFYSMILRTAVRDRLLGDSKFVSLDEMTGSVPRFPTGEVPYLFGYSLMREFAQRNGGTAQLGKLSWESGGRLPFFINSYAEAIGDRSWHEIFSDWRKSEAKLADAALEKIRKQPVSNPQWITEGGLDTFGMEFSPRSNQIAYMQNSADRRSGLWILDQASGKKERIADMLGGSRMSFDPQGRGLIFSKLERRQQYQLRSDLFFYDLKTKRVHRLTTALRAKDPHFSPKGDWIVFTLTESSRTGLAKANIDWDQGHPRLGAVERLYFPSDLGRISTPRVSPDGLKLAFSVHDGKTAAESIALWDLKTHALRILDLGPGFHRYPIWKTGRDLIFVSNRTGIDTIYEVSETGKGLKPLTNLETGAWYPQWHQEKLYASVFKLSGWNLAQLPLLELQPQKSPFGLDSVPRATPPREEPSSAGLLAMPTPKTYSALKTLPPRQWAPLLLWDSAGVRAGGQVSGFDQLDFHEYLAGGTYDFNLKKPEGFFIYRNRSWGPTLGFSGSRSIGTRTLVNNQVARYTVRSRGTVDLSMPFIFTFSSITPALRYNIESEKLYTHSGNSSAQLDSYFRDRPSADASVTIRSIETNPLAISPERGFQTFVGGRSYYSGGRPYSRAVLAHQQYVNLTDHVVLSPKLTFAQGSLNRSVSIFGRQGNVFEQFVNTSLDELPIRGYPFQAYYVRSAQQGFVELRFPLLRWFRGIGTLPVFFENIHGKLFAEATRFAKKEYGLNVLGSGGGALTLDSEFLYLIPIQLAVEYHSGFNTRANGRNEVFVSLNLGSLGF